MTASTQNVLFGTPIFSDAGQLYSPTFDDSGDWESTLPLTNLQTRYLAEVARSSSAAIADTRLRCDLKADRLVRVVALPKHSLSSDGYVRVLGVPSSLLFDYEAGDDIAARGGTFARADAATCATYIDRNGIVKTVAAAIPRDGHFISSVRTNLLELSRANICLQSEDFSTTWTTSNSSVSTNADTAPDGTATADRLIEDATAATSHFVTQNITVTADASQAFSVFAKKGTGRDWITVRVDGGAATNRFAASFNLNTGVVGTSQVAGTATFTRALITATGDGWYRCTVVGIIGGGDTSVRAQVYLNEADNDATYDGDGASYVSLWGAQLEDSATFPTSYVKATTGSVTRAVDVLSYPIPSGMTTPAASTFYVKFVERGTILSASATRVIYIGETGGGAASALIIDTSGSFYRARLFDSGSSDTSSSTLAAAPAFGDTVELRVTVSATGVVQIHQSINGAAEVSATAGAAGGLPTQWGTGTAKIFFNCDSTAGARAGAIALQSVRTASGSKTLAEMQAIVYDSGWVASYPSGQTAETLEGLNVPHVQIIDGQNGFTARYWSVQIDDTSNSADYVDLARLCICGGWQPESNAAYGARFRWSSSTTAEETDGSSYIYNARTRRRLVVFTLPMMSESDAFTYPWQMDRILGSHGQFFFVWNPDDTTLMHERSFLCVHQEPTDLDFAFFGRLNVPRILREEL